MNNGVMFVEDYDNINSLSLSDGVNYPQALMVVSDDKNSYSYF